MSRVFRHLISLVTVALVLCGSAFASSTATITVNGSEQSGDANTITISFNGFTETVNYGQYSTTASIASAFGAKFSKDYVPAGMCAHATGAVITFQLQGTATFGALDVTGSTTSFQLTSSGFLSQESVVADVGTVTLTVNGVLSATTNYGEGATPSSVAAGLAAGVQSGSPVKVTATDDALYIVATGSGSGTDYSYSIQNTAYNNSVFSQPSFPASTISGTLSGGDNSGSNGGQTVYSYSASYDGTGNLTGSTDSVTGTWSFTYDYLNRLASATAGSNVPAPYTGDTGCWTYDAFGNRLSQSMSTTACANNPPKMSWAQYGTTVNGSNNNQMSATNQNGSQASGYDASGDVTYDGVNTYLYDGEGRICAVKSEPVPGTYTYTGYVYDADGTRVAKGSVSTWGSCDPTQNGFQTVSDYILGPSDEQMTEMGMDPDAGVMTWAHSNVWADGRLLATYDSDGLHFHLTDPLGTRRVNTDYAGVTDQTCSTLPFGETINCTAQSPTEHLFTGKERDQESGNDYFGARYYVSGLGRWLSPDWSAKVEPVPYFKLDDPQSLNLYAYVLNNPMTGHDEDGHDDSAPGGDAYNSAAGQAQLAFEQGGDSSVGASNFINSAAIAYTAGVIAGAQQQNASSTSSGRTTTITHEDGTVEVRTGTPAFRDNNPGNIHPTDFTRSHGQIGVDPGTRGVSGPFAVFENTDSGRAALSAMISTPQVGSRTIQQEMKRYASSKGDNPAGYAREIAGRVGVGVKTRISALSPAQREVIVQAIVTHEGSAGTVRIRQP